MRVIFLAPIIMVAFCSRERNLFENVVTRNLRIDIDWVIGHLNGEVNR